MLVRSITHRLNKSPKLVFSLRGDSNKRAVSREVTLLNDLTKVGLVDQALEVCVSNLLPLSSTEAHTCTLLICVTGLMPARQEACKKRP